VNVTLEQLVKIMPEGKKRLPQYVDALNAAMAEFDINTESRIEAFLSQLAHESGRFLYMHELASGQAYEGRLDLGNTDPGDGRRFRGHGPIQITGRANHLKCSIALYGDERLLYNPELLEQPVDGCRSAAWFWKTNGLNELADKIGDGVDDVNDFNRISKRVNGGWNGKEDRLAVWEIAQLIIPSEAA
jgi:putative chitinase